MHNERVSQTFNLGLEVLKGCGYSCSGCTVDKNFADFDVPEDDARAILGLLADLKAQDWRMLELKIGPTDITSSDNGFAVLQHPVIKEIASYYKVLTLNAAMLHDRNLPELAELVDELMPGKYVNIGTPFTLKNVANEKYMAMMKERLAYFQSLLKKASFTRLYATINIEEENLKQFNPESFSLIRNYDFGSGIDKVIEFPFVNARQGFDNLLIAERFKRDIKQFADFAKTRINTHEFVPLIPGVKEGYEYTYRTGKLYSTIVLVENLTLYKDKYELARPWTGERLLKHREDAYINNLVKYSEHPQCGTCCFLDHCARCDVQHLMEETGSDTCLIEMHNRWDLAHVEH